MLVLLNSCTTATIMKCLEKRVDGNNTRVLRSVLNKDWKQCLTKQRLYGHLPHVTQTVLIKFRSHARHWWKSKDELISDVLQWTPTHGHTRVERLVKTYINRLNAGTGCCLEDVRGSVNKFPDFFRSGTFIDKVSTIGRLRNCLDAHLGQIVCDKDGVVDWCIVLVEMPLTRFEECWPLLTEPLSELPSNLNIATLTLTLWPINSGVLTSLLLPHLWSSLTN